MTRGLAFLAAMAVRGWTRVYTWPLPAGLKEWRRAEIESDLWEFAHDAETAHDSFAWLHVVSRLLRGVPSDVLWSVEHIVIHRGARRRTAMASAIGLLVMLGGFWIYDTLSPQNLPTPPPIMQFSAAPRPWLLTPPPPPPPPPPPKPSNIEGTAP